MLTLCSVHPLIMLCPAMNAIRIWIQCQTDIAPRLLAAAALHRALAAVPSPAGQRVKLLRILAKTQEPQTLSRLGFSVNWSVRQFRTYDQSSAGRIRTYNPPVNSRLLYH